MMSPSLKGLLAMNLRVSIIRHITSSPGKPSQNHAMNPPQY